MTDQDSEVPLRNVTIETLLEERKHFLEQIKTLKTQLLQAGITPFSFHTKSTPDLSHSKRYSLPTYSTPKLSERQYLSFEKSLSTYDKRSGTNDLGKQYEYIMCAFYAIRFATSDHVSDFEMTTNDEVYGDFDDIALKVRYTDGKYHTYLLQLKHTENKKGLTEKILSAEKKDFSLMKYLKTFQNLAETSNISCILFTNRTAHFKEMSKFNLNDFEIFVKEYQKVNCEELLDTSQSLKRGVFQFGTTETNEIYSFLEQFYLFANQCNVSKIKILITDVLKQLLQCDIYDNFIHFMKNWWCGNFVLTKNDVIAKLTELTFSPFICTISSEKANEKSDVLAEAILDFDLTLVEGVESDIISEIWQTNEEIREVSLTALKYGLTNKGISDLDELTAEQRSKTLWYLNQVPLLVKVYDSRKEQIKCGLKLLEKMEKKKMIVVLGEFQDFSDWYSFKSLRDLKGDLYKVIVENFEVSLQGRKPIPLNTLIQTENQADIIKVRQLCLMTQNPLLIGEKQIVLPEFYVSRTISTNFLNTKKVIQHCSNNKDLLILICENSFRETLKSYNFSNLEEFDGETETSLLVTNKCSKTQFDKICQRSRNRRVHLIKVVDSSSSVLFLSTENNLKSEDLKQIRLPIPEEEILEIFDNPINVLCAQPGIGKSTMIKFLDNNCPQDFWSVRVNLRKFNSLLKEEPEEEEILLYFLELGAFDNSLVDQIKRLFFASRKIYLFLDGLDEIESNCVDFALDYVNYIASTGIHVWISSRQNLEGVITTRLNIFPINIEELKQEEQSKYIFQRLEVRYQTEEIEKILEGIFHSADVTNSRNMLGIPLQLYIITENFLDDDELFTKLNQKIFVLTKMYKIFFDGKKKHLYEKVGVQYEQQLGFNFNLYLENYEIPALRCCLDDTTFQSLNLETNSKNLEFLEMIKNEGDKFGIISQINEDRAVFTHQTYAEYFACLWLKKNFSKVRILKDEIKGEKYQNLRLIFDIMLAENCPLHLAIIYKNTEQVRKHLSEIQTKDEGNRTPLHLICSYGSKYLPLRLEPSQYSNHLFHAENQFCGENIEYREIFSILDQCDPFQTDDVYRWNSIEYSFHFQCLYPVEKFLERYGDRIKVDSLLERLSSISLVYYSTKLGYPHLLEAVIRRNRGAIHFKIGEEKLSFLHVAVKGVAEEMEAPLVDDSTKIKIIQILLKSGIEINIQDKNGATPLHLAVAQGSFNIVKVLLDEGSQVNSTTNKEETVIHYALQDWEYRKIPKSIVLSKDGTTLFHWACVESDYELIKTLLDDGEDVNQTNNMGENALHYTVRSWRPNLEIIRLLVEKGIDINCNDNHGISPLHWAFDKGHYDVIGILHKKGATVTTITPQHEETLRSCYKPFRPNMYVMEMLMDYGFNVNAQNSDGTTVLHHVAEKGHDRLVRLLMSNGANVNATNNNNETILHYDSRSSNTKLIKMFKEMGADVNGRDVHGVTPLHRAAERGNFDMLKVLVQEGGNIAATTNHGENILSFAVKTNEPRLEVISYLIKKRIDVNGRDQEGVTPLHWACERGHYDIAKLLIEEGASVNSTTQRGDTPLHYANPNPDIVKLLIENGVEINAGNVDGMTALHWAAERGQYDLTKTLLSSGGDVNATTREKETVLIHTTKQRKINIEVVRLLVKKDANIFAIDSNGTNALHWACESGHYDVVKLLLENGIDVNYRNNKKESVLHFASKSWKPNTEIIKKLVSAGVDINGQDDVGTTALHWAAKEGHFMNVEILINLNADVKMRTWNEETTLHFAAKAWKINDNVLDLLIEKGVDVDSVDKDKKTALHWAAEKGFYDNVRILLERGATVDAVTSTNLTALHFAVYGGHVRIIKLLLSKGLNINKVDTKNFNLPLHFAVRNGHLKEELLVMMAATIHDKFPLLSWKRYSHHEVTTYLQEAQPYMEPIPFMRNASTSMENRPSLLQTYRRFVGENFGHAVAWLRNIFCKKAMGQPRTPTFIVHYPVFPTDSVGQEVKSG